MVRLFISFQYLLIVPVIILIEIKSQVLNFITVSKCITTIFYIENPSCDRHSMSNIAVKQ